MVKILGLPFDEYVDKQINIRQSKLAKTVRDPEDLVVFNANTAWLRISSGVRIDLDRAEELSDKLGIPASAIEGTNLAKNLILWGGASSFTQDENTGNLSLGQPRGGVGYGLSNAYGFLTTSDQGYRPMPGITGMTCNYKNNGSLRQATVNIKCHSRSQFEAIEAIYLRLGYTMVMEWGNTVWFDNEGNKKETTRYTIPNIVFSDTPDPDILQEQILTNRVSTGGNYDAMVGKVQNYSWTLNEDLSFDIVLELISVGDIIESLKANITSTSAVSAQNIQTSGSTQNILNIVVNKQASQLNTFFYELWALQFRDPALRYGSEEAKKVVQEVNETEAIIPLLQEVKDTTLAALKPFIEVRDKLVRAFELAKQIKFVNLNSIELPTQTQTELTGIATDLQITLDTLIAAITSDGKVDENAKTNSLGAFSNSIKQIESYVDRLTVDSPENRTLVKALSEKYKKQRDGAEDTIYRAMNGLSIIENGTYEIPGAEFDDGANFIDYRLTDILEKRFNKVKSQLGALGPTNIYEGIDG